jgi:hypothetical protein
MVGSGSRAGSVILGNGSEDPDLCQNSTDREHWQKDCSFDSAPVLRIRDVLSRIPEPDPNIFSSRIRIQTFFHPGSRILHEKCNANLLFSYFIWFQEQSHSQQDPGSVKNSSRIRIPEVMKSTGSRIRIRIRNTAPRYAN